MSTVDWVSMVSPSGGIRYELVDRDAPTAWVIYLVGHQATYRGRVMEDRTDERGRLSKGALRRMELSFNLPTSVRNGLGTGRVGLGRRHILCRALIRFAFGTG